MGFALSAASALSKTSPDGATSAITSSNFSGTGRKGVSHHPTRIISISTKGVKVSRLYKRKGSRKWWADFNDPSHPKADKTGRVRTPLFTDKDRSLEELGRLIGSAENAVIGKPVNDSSYLAFKEKFMRHISTKNRVTISEYKRAIKNLEDGAPVPINRLSQITPNLLNNLKTEWTHKKRGLYVRNRDLQAIKAMMHFAEAMKLIVPQDWRIVKLDKEPKGRLLWYTPEEVRGLLNVCHGTWKTIALLGVRAGLRRSEMHWLSWKDVDFARKRIHVSPKKEWNPKDHERRWVPMADDMKAHLESLPNRSEWVLDDGDGRPTVGAMTTYFSRLSRKAHLKGNIHTLRHTYASHLASSGVVSIQVIKDLMGHSKVEMTLRYAHLAPSTLQSASDALPKI